MYNGAEQPEASADTQARFYNFNLFPANQILEPQYSIPNEQTAPTPATQTGDVSGIEGLDENLSQEAIRRILENAIRESYESYHEYYKKPTEPIIGTEEPEENKEHTLFDSNAAFSKNTIAPDNSTPPTNLSLYGNTDALYIPHIIDTSFLPQGEKTSKIQMGDMNRTNAQAIKIIEGNGFTPEVDIKPSSKKSLARKNKGVEEYNVTTTTPLRRSLRLIEKAATSSAYNVGSDNSQEEDAHSNSLTDDKEYTPISKDKQIPVVPKNRNLINLDEIIFEHPNTNLLTNKP